MKPILEIQNVSKKFRINHEQQPYLSLRDSITNIFKSKNSMEDFWALKDVSFNVEQGDTIGVIGKNGAGKSTLLKILSKITPPSSGKIIGRGRIASLLEVGTGFHPELSGRENILMNGSILGMRRFEILKNFDAIVDFAGVEKFIDTPLKHYSSGMQLRLAFAVAAFLENEILIIDEVLAVGDAEFQKKCMGKMEDVSKSGRTILFVSHNMPAVKSLCTKGVVLQKGTVSYSGPISESINQYLTTDNYEDKNLELIEKRRGNKKVIFSKFNVTTESNSLSNNILTGDTIELHFTLKIIDAAVSNIDVGFSLHDIYDEMITCNYSSYQNQVFKIDGDNYMKVRFKIYDFPFLQSKIFVKGRIVVDNEESDWPQENIGSLSVEQGDFYGTGRFEEMKIPYLLKGDWKS